MVYQINRKEVKAKCPFCGAEVRLSKEEAVRRRVQERDAEIARAKTEVDKLTARDVYDLSQKSPVLYACLMADLLLHSDACKPDTCWIRKKRDEDQAQRERIRKSLKEHRL